MAGRTTSGISAEGDEMDMEQLRSADPESPAADYIKGVPGTVGELLDALDTHGVDGIEAAQGIGPVTADAIRRALADDRSAGHIDWTPCTPYVAGDRFRTPDGSVQTVEHDSETLSSELDRERDTLAAELKRRHRAGESHVALATEYGLMPSRVAQLTRE